jgi:GR25 family glycosyltransferase involved in LPS biosynthesis
MNLAYTIISVDDSRAELKSSLREELSIPEVTDIPFVDGRNHDEINALIDEYDCSVKGRFHYGELGVWFSQLNCWQWLAGSGNEALIVFEDDAVVAPGFEDKLDDFLKELPVDFDFFSLFVPVDQLSDYYYDRRFLSDGGWELNSSNQKRFTNSIHYINNPLVSTAYQGYSCVATMYSRKGAEKMISLFESKGIYTPVDCFLFLERNLGNLNGYSPTPTAPKLAWFVEKGTIARSTGMYS